MTKYSWHSPKLIVKNTGKYGEGVFAGEDIKKGTVVYVLSGKKMSTKDFAEMVNSDKENIDDPLQVGKRTYIDLDNISRTFNHSCNPTIGIRKRSEMFALRNIKKGEQIAFDVGKEIALSDNITVYGAEKDYDSLSTAASRGAKSVNGLTVGVTYGKGKDIWDKNRDTDIIISTGMDRGGGREFVLVNSCDAIIALSGGSGTLTEIAIAYQSNIPIIVIGGTGGWADKLADTYLDNRKRLLTIKTNNANEAVKKVLEELNK